MKTTAEFNQIENSWYEEYNARTLLILIYSVICISKYSFTDAKKEYVGLGMAALSRLKVLATISRYRKCYSSNMHNMHIQ